MKWFETVIKKLDPYAKKLLDWINAKPIPRVPLFIAGTFWLAIGFSVAPWATLKALFWFAVAAGWVTWFRHQH